MLGNTHINHTTENTHTHGTQIHSFIIHTTQHTTDYTYTFFYHGTHNRKHMQTLHTYTILSLNTQHKIHTEYTHTPLHHGTHNRKHTQ